MRRVEIYGIFVIVVVALILFTILAEQINRIAVTFHNEFLISVLIITMLLLIFTFLISLAILIIESILHNKVP